jgi:hypothetical protein
MEDSHDGRCHYPTTRRDVPTPTPFTAVARPVAPDRPQRGHPEQTVASFADWCRRFILFPGKRHPRELGLTEVAQFLESAAL